MRVLITGSNGFVGKALTEYLVGMGMEIVAIDRNIDFLSNKKINFYNINITLDSDFSVPLKNVDVVIHLAARAHFISEKNESYYSQYRAENYYPSINLLNQAIRSGVKRFIYFSSIGVNGIQTLDKPFSESDLPSPGTPYTLSKYETEQSIIHLCKNNSMEYVIIRPTLIYGPDAPGNFARLVSFIKKGIPIPLGGLKNKRSYLSIYNLLDFLRLAISSPYAANQVFLVADGDDISTTNLISHISSAMSLRTRLFAIGIPALNLLLWLLRKQSYADSLLLNLEVDITKAKNVLGWIPPYKMKEGLEKTFDQKV
jgi:nucleoside-diphosphate-sugar epimerase